MRKSNIFSKLTYLFSLVLILTTSCSGNTTPGETIKNGAYFITDESWDNYSRIWAESVKHLIPDYNDDFVQKVINETITIEDTNGINLLPPRRKLMWVAVIDKQMTISDGQRKVYHFIRENDKYYGETFNETVEFKLNNDILKIINNNMETEYYYDSSCMISDDVLKLDKPKNIEYSCGGEGLNYAFFKWDCTMDDGLFGVGVEIRKNGQEEFVLNKIEYPYHNTYVVQFERSDFIEGTNMVRFRNLGGPNLTNNPLQVSKFIDSEYVLYEVIVDNNDGVLINEVE
ncbi:MAG: hypothetical protein BWX74_00844 [Tenericutes bacterium ADurb.Bin087]|nr:MAG: hypothetical protein BWX74_00844 [Tenericutes bacterium ADurb.Bin087]